MQADSEKVSVRRQRRSGQRCWAVVDGVVCRQVSEREASREEERAALLGELEAMMAERHLLKTTIHQLTEDVTRARGTSSDGHGSLSSVTYSSGTVATLSQYIDVNLGNATLVPTPIH